MKRTLLSALVLSLAATISLAQETEKTPQMQTPIVFEPEQTTYAFWFKTEYLLWWIRNHPLPAPLASAALPPFTSPNPGAVNDLQTDLLIGGERIDTDVRHGGRFTLGFWGDSEGEIGVEGNYFFLGKRSQTRSFQSDGSLDSAIIGVPFQDVVGFFGAPGSEVFLPFSVPGLTAGQAQISISTFLQGAEANVVLNLLRDAGFSTNFLVGYRYLQLEENLTLSNSLQGLGFAQGLNIRFEDHFDTRNNFNGGQLGLATQFRRGRWFCDTAGKVAIGQMNQVVDVYGNSTFTAPFGPPPLSGQDGFFAQTTNSGPHSRNVFAFIPELTVNLGVNVTERICAFVGYNFIYVNNVLRPGDQIDRSLNLSQSSTIGIGSLIGAARPTTLFNSTDFWAQGINFGFQVRY